MAIDFNIEEWRKAGFMGKPITPIFASGELDPKLADPPYKSIGEPIWSGSNLFPGGINWVEHPPVDWEKTCAVLQRALRMAQSKIARLEAVVPKAESEPSVSENLAALFRRSTVPDWSGR